MGVTLPDIGVDVGAYATAMGTSLGAIFGTVLAISAVFIAARIGWRWLRRVAS